MQWQIIGGLFFSAGILAGQTVHLKTRSFDGGDEVRAASRPMTRRHWTEGRSHFLLQFQSPINDDIRAQLALRGAVITGTVPDDAVVVAAGDDFSPEGLDAVFVEEVNPEDKTSPLNGTHGNDAAFLVEFHGDVEPEAARSLLRSEGFTVVDHPDLAGNDVLVLGGMADVERLKAWDEVAYVFPAPAEMVNGERFHTCTGALSAGMAVPQYVRMGHGWSPNASGQVNLGYVFGALTTKVPDDVVKGEVVRAMLEWSKVARVQFSPVNSQTATRTIAVKFATGDHGDGFPFDGPNGILAHTFYPANPEPQAGDMHLDSAEGWHAGTNIDVYTVALHELGHALGLGHSDQPGAIMYPYYRFPAQIGIDDIAGIQSIYGAPSLAPSSTPSVPAMAVTIQSPAAGLLPVNTTAVNVTGTIANPSGIAVVTWQTDHGASGKASGNISWNALAVPTPVGSTTITVTAIDALHRTSQATVTVVRPQPTVQDATAPVITLSSPAGTTVQTTLAKLTVTGTATDNVNVARVTWQNGGFGSGTATGTKAWTVADIPLLVGTNTLIFRAFDSAGNSSWRSVTVVRR